MTTSPLAVPVGPSRGELTPLGLGEVRITGGYWGRMQQVNATATLDHIHYWLEREGWLANFDRAAAGSLTAHNRKGREFADSEVFKYLEALAWEIGRLDDPQNEVTFRQVVRRVAAAQEADGYLNTRFGRPTQAPRWSDLEWGHELYCAGHLMQAAVARARTRPEANDGLVGIAVRVADLVCEVFGPGGIERVCGHPEVEMGLVELGRVTGTDRYFDMARLFVERRGHGTLADIELGRAYFQDEIPVREATTLRGHAVRANYLASGATDVAIETGDEDLLDALERQWATTIARRTYLTGGQGSRHEGEAFGEDFELPSDRAYAETCAGIASIQFSWRLLLARGGARYADIIERTLFNVVATSPSADGRAFYYSNTLQRHAPGEPHAPHAVSPRAEASLRAPWFDVSCCPPNLARTFASLATLVATRSHDSLHIHQFADADISTVLATGEHVELTMRTDYPATGRIEVHILRDADAPWALHLRVPAWAEGATISVGSQRTSVSAGMAGIYREFRAGEVVVLDVPMEARLTRPDPRIDALRGCRAIERGPLVMALESVDLPEHWLGVDEARLDVNSRVFAADGRSWVPLVRLASRDSGWPYGTITRPEPESAQEVPLVPYNAWAERGPSTMRVWIPLADAD